jgi:hypothetical protein
VRSQLVQIDATMSPQDTTAPRSAIACNGNTCSGGWYTAPASVAPPRPTTHQASQPICYALDGSTPTAASPLSTGPFTVSQTATCPVPRLGPRRQPGSHTQPARADRRHGPDGRDHGSRSRRDGEGRREGDSHGRRRRLRRSPGQLPSERHADHLQDGRLHRERQLEPEQDQGPAHADAVAEDVAGSPPTSKPVTVTVR